MKKTAYIVTKYIKIFLIILVGLSFFYVILDYVQISHKLPKPANIQLLYIYYRFLNSIAVLTPLVIVFSMIVTVTGLVKDNYLVALYSLGYSRKSILTPIFGTAIVMTLVYISLFTTDLAYSKEYAETILQKKKLSYTTKNMFFKYDTMHEKTGENLRYLVYFDKFYPMQKLVENVRIFVTQNGMLLDTIQAKHGRFDNNKWIFFKVKLLKKSESMKLNSVGINIEFKEKIELLKGFKPTVLSSLYEGKSDFSLKDLYDAIYLMNKQKLNTEKLKVIAYNILIFPFFAPLLIVIIFFATPIHSRVKNINIFTFSVLLSSLLVWGVFFALIQLALNGSFSGEFTILLPVFLLSIYSLYLVRFKK
jgi:lipopolysaccharide export system permease protein